MRGSHAEPRIQRSGGEEQDDHDGLPGLHAQVETEEGEGEATRGQLERLDGRGEAESVHEPEAEAHEPAMRRRILAQEVLESDPHDGGGDGRLHDAGGNGDHAQHGEGEGDAVGDGEGGDDLEERQEGPATEEEGREE
jgi:AAA ATPase containing von Willebrand factor type A (vWA) domain